VQEYDENTDIDIAIFDYYKRETPTHLYASERYVILLDSTSPSLCMSLCPSVPLSLSACVCVCVSVCLVICLSCPVNFPVANHRVLELLMLDE